MLSKSLLLSVATCLGLCTFHAPAFADDSSEFVIVTATRVPTPESEVASSVTTVTAADIQARQFQSLPDILRDVPGLNLVQSGGEGDEASVFMRGTNSNHVKVLVDGIDVADPSTPNDTFDFGKFDTASIQQVEVLRGPGSALYGSDAVGGVINIVTKSGDGPFSVDADLDGGSFSTFNQDVTLSGSTDGFHYRATITHEHSGDTPVTPPELLLPGETAVGDYFDGLNASTKLGYDLSDNLDLGLVARYSNDLEHVTGDGFSLATFTGFPSPTPSRIDVLQYETRGTVHLVLGRFDQTLGIAYSSAETSDADPNNGYSLTAGNRIKLDWQGNISVADGEILVLGAETARDAIHQPLSAGITTNAGFAELETKLGDFDSAASLRYDDNSRFGGKLTWHVAPTYLVAQTGTRFKATAGTGFKAPSIEDLFGPFGHNQNLKPETSFGYDLGVEQDLDVLGMGGTFLAGVTWFQNQIANLIDSGPPPDYAPVNIGHARTEGVESFVAWAPLATLKLRADYTYTEAEDSILHTPLLRRPKNKVSVNAGWQVTPEISLDASLLYIGPWHDIGRESFVPVNSPGAVTADIAGDYALSSMITLEGRVSNLFDARYQDPNGFLQPGRGVYAGIRAGF